MNSENLFGCVGLKKAKYCILNKQYSKEEYEELVPRIIEQMRQSSSSPRRGEGRARPELDSGVRGSEPLISNSSILAGEESVGFGEFFPPSFSPFGYNETIAADYAPITKEEALRKSFNWSDYTPSPPHVEKTVKASQLPDAISDIPDSILDWAIECEVSARSFRIIKQELRFLREHNIPLPRRHPDIRYRDRLAMRNPRLLFSRTCDSCAKNIETSYPPDRPEKILCSECYLTEVY
jgi:hypothetical protein